MNLEDFSGYVLAGGKSSRMGEDKAFLQIGEKTFVENSIGIIKPICGDRTKVVLNPNQKHFIEKIPNETPIIFDIYENKGPLSGIHTALEDCETKWAIILAVDLPLVTTEIIKHLASVSDEHQNYSAIVTKQKNGKLQPLCATYKVKSCLPLIKNMLVNAETISVVSFLNRLVIKSVSEKEFDSKTPFLNINEPSDYIKL